MSIFWLFCVFGHFSSKKCNILWFFFNWLHNICFLLMNTLVCQYHKWIFPFLGALNRAKKQKTWNFCQIKPFCVVANNFFSPLNPINDYIDCLELYGRNKDYWFSTQRGPEWALLNFFVVRDIFPLTIFATFVPFL